MFLAHAKAVSLQKGSTIIVIVATQMKETRTQTSNKGEMAKIQRKLLQAHKQSPLESS